VDHAVHSVEGRARVVQLAVYDLDLRWKAGDLAARSHQRSYQMSACTEPSLHVGADEAGDACDEDAHLQVVAYFRR